MFKKALIAGAAEAVRASQENYTQVNLNVLVLGIEVAFSHDNPMTGNKVSRSVLVEWGDFTREDVLSEVVQNLVASLEQGDDLSAAA